MHDPSSLYSEVYDRGRLKTAYGLKSKSQNFYYFLLGKDEVTGVDNHKQYFTGRTEIFTNSLLIGFFHNKKSKENANDSFNRVSDVHEEHETIVKMIFIHLCKRPENLNKDPPEMLTELCSYADGGIEYLIEHYAKNEDVNMRKTNLLYKFK